jgi:hypothetical protein
LAYFNLAERQAGVDEKVDHKLIEHNRARWALLNQPVNPAVT